MNTQQRDENRGEAKGADKGGKPPITIYINETPYQVDEKSMTGAELKVLASVPAEYNLFLEARGDDQPVSDDQSIKLHKDMKFYSLPPATFG